MTRALIIDGGGFVDRAVAKSLVVRGVCVRVFVRPTTDLSRLAEVSQEIEIAKGDFLNVTKQLLL